ncbi:MAG: type II toxin-antitoxin system Phd/YefM family antitoxin [Spirochaetaceae bacterium]|nr:MAG: type II toxin-antitoxin system Phd/YefM family antitoxin [Spirochaetaceae bacterium]
MVNTLGMSTTLRASNIVSLARFKARASEVINNLNSSQEPVVITQNGAAAAVLVTPADFDRLVTHAAFMESVQRGLADVEAGRVIDHGLLAAEVTERYGE